MHKRLKGNVWRSMIFCMGILYGLAANAWAVTGEDVCFYPGLNFAGTPVCYNAGTEHSTSPLSVLSYKLKEGILLETSISDGKLMKNETLKGPIDVPMAPTGLRTQFLAFRVIQTQPSLSAPITGNVVTLKSKTLPVSAKPVNISRDDLKSISIAQKGVAVDIWYFSKDDPDPSGQDFKFVERVAEDRPNFFDSLSDGDQKRLKDNEKRIFVRVVQLYPQTFSLIMASDPQLGMWPTQSPEANEWLSKAMKVVNGWTKWPDKRPMQPIKAAIFNGDLTNCWCTAEPRNARKGQIGDFFDDYGSLPYPLLLGFGNHDYVMPYSTRPKESVKEFMYPKIEQEIRFSIPGVFRNYHKDSMAYSWDIGAYHFVQLHMHPMYQSKDIQSQDIKPSVDWLKKDIETANNEGKKIVLTMHAFNYEDWKISWWINFVQDNPGIVALFFGHTHKWGLVKKLSLKNDFVVPVFECGAATWSRKDVTTTEKGSNTEQGMEYGTKISRFLLAEFGDSNIRVAAINGRKGKATLDSNEVSIVFHKDTTFHRNADQAIVDFIPGQFPQNSGGKLFEGGIDDEMDPAWVNEPELTDEELKSFNPHYAD